MNSKEKYDILLIVSYNAQVIWVQFAYRMASFLGNSGKCKFNTVLKLINTNVSSLLSYVNRAVRFSIAHEVRDPSSHSYDEPRHIFGLKKVSKFYEELL